MPKVTIDDIEFNTEDLNGPQLEVLVSLQFTDTEIKDQMNILNELLIVQSSYAQILKEALTLKK